MLIFYQNKLLSLSINSNKKTIYNINILIKLKVNTLLVFT
jgi:hypothetical protein